MTIEIFERMRGKALSKHKHLIVRSDENVQKTKGRGYVLAKSNQMGMLPFVPRGIARPSSLYLCARTLTILVAIFAFVWPLMQAFGQNQGAAGRFPALQRVTADYPDDAERFIVFNLLYSWLGDATRGRQSKGDYVLGNEYAHAAGEILDKYERQGRNSEVFRRFDAHSGELFISPGFKHSVVERYHLPNVPAARPAAAGGLTSPPRFLAGGPVVGGGSTSPPLFPEHGISSDEAIQAAFFEALPVWIAAVVAMFALAWVLMRSSGCALVTGSQPRNPSGNAPQLPESLRIVAVPGRRYEVELESGQVIDKETTLRTTYQTTTTGGQMEIQGGIPYQTPAQTQTIVTNTQEDLVWVRTTDSRETSWTLFGGAFKTRRGQIISIIGRPLRDGTRDFLLAFNHTTGQLQQFGGVQSVHTPKFLLPWFLIALAGSLPGAYGLGIMFHRLGGLAAAALPIQLLTLWIEGGIASAVIATIVALIMMRRIMSRRNAAFKNRYVPGYLEFFAQAMPALARRFNAP
jgi:hypothetical protein